MHQKVCLMKLASLDLEMTQPSCKIIQIGYCVGDTKTGEISHLLSLVIEPNEVITEYIEKLTGVTNKRVAEEGISLQQGYKMICEAHVDSTAFRNPLTWGGGDSLCLRNQLELDDERFVFGRRWLDVKTVYQAWRHAKNESPRSGLAKSLTRMGLKFEGTKHDALSDAINTFLIYIALLKEFQNER